MARSLTVVVDHTLCASTLLCFESAPGAFRLTGDGHAQAGDPSAASEAQLVEAARCCPTGAIKVLDAATGETVA